MVEGFIYLYKFIIEELYKDAYAYLCANFST